MKKYLLILLGALMSCSAFGDIVVALLPSDPPFVLKQKGNIGEGYKCWFQSEGDNIPVHITTTNVKPNSDYHYGTRAGVYTVAHPGATLLFFIEQPINREMSGYYYFKNEDYTYSTKVHSVLLIHCMYRDFHPSIKK